MLKKLKLQNPTETLSDFLICVALGLIFYGLYLVSVPVAYGLTGVLLLTLVLHARLPPPIKPGGNGASN